MSRFPAEAWHRLVYSEAKRLTAEPRRDAFDAQGHRPLREAIAQYVRRARGIHAEAEDILICNGSMQAIALLAQALVSPGDAVVMECPGYGGIARAIQAAGGVVLPGRVDACGIIPQAWPDARLLFATPSRQYPTGAVLPLERRQQLLRWAKQQQAVIVEDDYDSEFRWSGRPIEPLKALDRDGRVAYIATFSKTMLPELRIGYCIMPPSLMGTLAKAKQLFEPHPTSLLEQRALAAFMSSGQYERHLRRMKRHYSRKHTFIRKLLETQLHEAFDIIPSDAGLHLFGWWKHSRSRYNEYKYACEQAGVRWSDAGDEEPIPEQVGMCFGFSHLEEEAMEQGITTMTTIWRALN
jgi:GntR family transcriptional regulator/MocR family aminotransferase